MNKLILALTLMSTTAWGGVGVRNGGSGYQCDGTPPEEQVVLLEHLIAGRQDPTLNLNDRATFYKIINQRIKNQTIRQIISTRWNKYGDSKNWPTLKQLKPYTVFFYSPGNSPIPYLSDGTLPPFEPSHSLCVSPLYEPDLCCQKLVFSFFAPEDYTPTRIEPHYLKLSRTQINILELHESVYRSAWDLAKLPPPPNEAIQKEISLFVTTYGKPKQLPSLVIENVVTSLLTTKSQNLQTELELMRLWYWASLILR
jgi:hypothetical protein